MKNPGIIQRLKEIILLIYKAADNMVNHDGIEHAGYLAFIIMLAVFPFLVFFVAILGVLGQTSQGDQFIHMIIDHAPKYMINPVLPSINEILNGPPHALLTISILFTVWTSSSIVEGMRTVLNRAYHVHTPPNYYFRRALSIVQILILTVILIVAMLGLIVIPTVFNKLYGLFFTFNAASGGHEQLPQFSFFAGEWEFLRYVFAICILFFFVSTLYYVLPNVRHKWRDALPGAVVTVAGWVGLTKGMAYYLQNYSQVNLVYGSLANIIVFLLFFYIVNIIFIYGAEFNYLLEKYLGHKIIQKEDVAPERIKPTEAMNRVETQNEFIIHNEKK